MPDVHKQGDEVKPCSAYSSMLVGKLWGGMQETGSIGMRSGIGWGAVGIPLYADGQNDVELVSTAVAGFSKHLKLCIQGFWFKVLPY